VEKLEGRKVLVVGLARSGVAAAKLLCREGARVTATDMRSAAQLADAIAELHPLGVRFELGGHAEASFTQSEMIVVSPGVPLAGVELVAARKAGVPILGEAELAARFIEEPLLAITGTNGKSTTTALLGHLLEQGGKRVFVGGNLGLPLSERVLRGGALDYTVVELSSYQLEAVEELRPLVAILTNLSPDHLDRYPGPEAYYEAKRAIFRMQTADDYAILNAEDPKTLALHQGARSLALSFGAGPPQSRGIRDDGSHLVLRGIPGTDGGEERYPAEVPREPEARQRKGAPSREVRAEGIAPAPAGEIPSQALGPALRGRHNRENAMAAILAARLVGLSPDSIRQGLASFGGLPHRLELVRTLDGVEWINDSKATNVDSAQVALAALPGPIVWIAGGRGKGAPYAPLRPLASSRVKAILTIGEDADTIAAELGDLATTTPCGTLDEAVRKARGLAAPGDQVLLSPACASFDQFRSYEARGDAFRLQVEALG